VKAVDAPEPGVRGRLHDVLDAVTQDGRSRPRIRAASAAGLDTGHDAALDRLVAHILAGTSVVAPARSAAPFVRVSS
jgi:hypothetical protein